MDMALLIEEKNEVLTKKGSSWKDRGGTFRLKDPAEVGTPKKESDRSQIRGSDKGKGRGLDPAELREKQERAMFQIWRQMEQGACLQVQTHEFEAL